jgi:5-methyltetrahydrofolate--homocysteine methyltransferase
MALREGLTAAIINPKDEKMRETISAYRTLFGLKTKVLGQKAEESKDPLYKCILTGDKDNVVGCVEKYLNEGKDPLEINQKILIPALEEVGVRFEKREYFLPQLLLSAEAMQKAMERLEKAFPNGSKKEGASVVMATVKGDLHDIGKNIVAAVLKNYGFNVIDLGRDVPVEKIIEAVKKEDAAIVGLSALMTTTMGQMEVVINELKKKGIDVPTIIGGAVVTDNYAKKIGAAGYAKDAVSAVKEIKRILKGEI